jgi:predicted nucleic acid-binding protein
LSLSARSYLLDAGFIALHYSGNKEAKPYFDRILSGKARGYISEVNLAEFYYKTTQKKGMETAEAWYSQVRQASFEVVSPDEDITRSAAVWKVHHNGITLADCFALATLNQWADVLLTTDPVLSTIKGIRAVHIAPFFRVRAGFKMLEDRKLN